MAKVEVGKDSKLCSVDGCTRRGVFGEGSKRYCEYHCELFDRGTAYVKATPVVSSMAAFEPVIRLEQVVARVGRSVLDIDVDQEIAKAVALAPLLKIDPAVLERHMVMDGIGELVFEPGRVYANRVQVFLWRFIVDRACEQLGLPAVGKTVRFEGEPADGED
nr:MAG TPA: hypothetical protein [Bacteriophage sp.]